MTDLRFHHLGIAVHDLAVAVESFRTLFGHRVLAGPIDDEIQRVTICFVGSGAPGDIVYELLVPLAGAPSSPIDRVLARGNTSYHVCYETADLEATVARFVAEGAIHISGPVPAVAFGGRRIAWLMLPMRHLLELLESHRDGATAGFMPGAPGKDAAP
jgi:methylmalonyl-CoA/ethylmalonyl-CoA epimerase